MLAPVIQWHIHDSVMSLAQSLLANLSPQDFLDIMVTWGRNGAFIKTSWSLIPLTWVVPETMLQEFLTTTLAILTLHLYIQLKSEYTCFL